MCCNYVLAKIFRRCAANKIQSTFSCAGFGIFFKKEIFVPCLKLFCLHLIIISLTIFVSLNLHDKNTWVKIFLFQ